MIGALRTPEQQTVTVFGGSGFLGRYVVSALAQRGYRILVPTRQPNLSNFLPLGKVGQITPIHANLRNEDSVAHAVARADHVVNLVGILQETGRQRFDALQAQAPAMIARHAKKAVSFTHVSAHRAPIAGSESAYARSKAEGEAGLLRERPDAVILRPSLMFGPGDSSFNRFAALARMLPVAAAARRRDPVPADLCRRRGRGDRAGGGRHCSGRPGLRTRRARDPHHAPDDGLRLRGHRAQARHRAVAEQPRPGHGQRAGHARPADARPDPERARHHPRPGDPAGERQCGLRGGARRQAARSRAWASRPPPSRPSCRAISCASARPASSTSSATLRQRRRAAEAPDQDERFRNS